MGSERKLAEQSYFFFGVASCSASGASSGAKGELARLTDSMVSVNLARPLQGVGRYQ